MTDALRTAIIALVNTGGALLVAFHVVLTSEQLGAIGAFVNTALVVAALVWHKKTVTSNGA